MAIVYDFDGMRKADGCGKDDEVCVSGSLGRKIVRIRSNDPSVVENYLRNVLAEHGVTDEMLNVVMRVKNDLVETYIVPRRAFRPWQYDAEPDKQLLISPASVEVGGILITPVEEHFERIGADDVESIYGQVCF